MDDLELSPTEVQAHAVAWRENLDAIYDTLLLEHNATSWDLSFSNNYNIPRAKAMTVPKPTVITPQTCSAVLSKECSSQPAQVGTASGEGCCCSTIACPVACPSGCPLFRSIPLFFGLNYSSKTALSSASVETRLPHLIEDLATFMLIRGDYAWLGFPFVSCHNDTNYTLPTPLLRDYGTPLDKCKQTAPSIFERQYEEANVTMDCNSFRGVLQMSDQFFG